MKGSKFLRILLSSSVSIVILFASCKKEECEDNIDNNPVIENKGTFTDNRDGKEYEWLKIGSQIWMTENLAYKVDTGGSWAYLNDENNVTVYGYLYSWQVAIVVAPDGWHLPTDNEWKILEKSLGMNDEEVNNLNWRGIDEGSKIAGNNTLWENESLTNNVNFGASQFLALPAGGFNMENQSFLGLGKACYFWTATDNVNNAYLRILYSSYIRINRTDFPKARGFSIRCVKD